MSLPAILLLAAGASSRMGGRDKLLKTVAGQPLIADRARAALASGAPVIVVLPPRRLAPGRWAALDGLDLTRVAAPDAAQGMSASLACGVAALPGDATGAMVLLADMPEITAADIAALFAGFDGETILRGAAADGTPGHPVLFARKDFAALASQSGDAGARDYLSRAAARVRLVALPDRHALTDLDTSRDWARWRGASSSVSTKT